MPRFATSALTLICNEYLPAISRKSTPKPKAAARAEDHAPIIKIRRMDKEEHEEQETLLDLYKRALSVVPERGPNAEAAE